jgi:hypothetical protein
MNQIVDKWFVREYGYLVRDYDLLRSLRMAHPDVRKVNWILYSESLRPFKRFYR